MLDTAMPVGSPPTGRGTWGIRCTASGRPPWEQPLLRARRFCAARSSARTRGRIAASGATPCCAGWWRRPTWRPGRSHFSSSRPRCRNRTGSSAPRSSCPPASSSPNCRASTTKTSVRSGTSPSTRRRGSSSRPSARRSPSRRSSCSCRARRSHSVRAQCSRSSPRASPSCCAPSPATSGAVPRPHSGSQLSETGRQAPPFGASSSSSTTSMSRSSTRNRNSRPRNCTAIRRG